MGVVIFVYIHRLISLITFSEFKNNSFSFYSKPHKMKYLFIMLRKHLTVYFIITCKIYFLHFFLDLITAFDTIQIYDPAGHRVPLPS